MHENLPIDDERCCIIIRPAVAVVPITRATTNHNHAIKLIRAR
jgi:hypothetical protein